MSRKQQLQLLSTEPEVEVLVPSGVDMEVPSPAGVRITAGVLRSRVGAPSSRFAIANRGKPAREDLARVDVRTPNQGSPDTILTVRPKIPP